MGSIHYLSSEDKIESGNGEARPFLCSSPRCNAATSSHKTRPKAAGEKSVSMIKQKDLLPLTGYVHGGCSPIGMKKQFTTFIHESARDYDIMYVSAGKVGYQIELAPDDLARAVGCGFEDII